MRSNPSTSTATATAHVPSLSSGGMSRGLLAGLAPAVLLLVLAALAALVAFIVQLATPGQDFATQQTIALSVVVVGLVLAFIVYAIGCVRALRCVGAWQRAGEGARAAGALWGLGIGALIVVLPLILGAVLPQQPAPVLR